MKHTIAIAIAAVAFPFACPAQEAATTPTQSADEPVGIAWLKQFEGRWSTDFNGTMNCRIIGDRWLINEISFGDGVFSVQTIGYDKKQKKFVGTWVDATSDFIWRYTGTLDAAGKVLVLEAEGPDMNDASKMRQYRDTYEFKSNREIVSVTKILEGDQWKTFNTGKMTRQSKE